MKIHTYKSIKLILIVLSRYHCHLLRSTRPSANMTVFKCLFLQLFYHYNIVLQLKTLYDEILRPELLEDQSLGDTAARHTATPSGKEKGKAGGGGGGVGGGKKEKEREKGGAGGKEKKGKAAKEEVHKESVPEIPGERRTNLCYNFIIFIQITDPSTIH